MYNFLIFFIMTKEEFITVREKYRTDLECIKSEGFNKKQYYDWKVEFGLSKRAKKDKQKQDALKQMTPEQFMNIRNKYSSNEECAKALGLGKDQFYAIKRSLGLNQEYDHSEIDPNTFKILYDKGLNDQEIAEEMGTNGKRICAFRNKLNLPNNINKHLEFTDDQYQIFIGGMLGDSCLRVQSECKNASLSFAHSLKQENYALWKHKQLKNLCFDPYYAKEQDKRNGNIYECVCVRSYTNELFTQYLDKFYYELDGKRIKYINKDLLYTLEPLGIAVWFMDDGYKKECGYCFSTNCFSKQDLEIIIQFFKDKYDIVPTIHKSNVLYIGAKYKDKFTNLIKPYIHNDCLYKIH